MNATNVIAELKRKREQVSSRLQDVERERAELLRQIASLDHTIAIYDPSSGEVPAILNGTDAHRVVSRLPRRLKGDRKVDPAEINELFRSINVSQTVLGILQGAGRPMATSECAENMLPALGLEREDVRVPFVVDRVARVLDNFRRRGIARSAGKLDGLRHVWELAAGCG